MSVLNNYITFLKEYKKLLERGVKDIFAKSISHNFIWIDDINNLVESNICNSKLPLIFTVDFTKQELLLTIQKPLKPTINISDEFFGIIEFNEAKNKFESLLGESEIEKFNVSEKGKIEIEKIKSFEKIKSIYSKLYRAYNDIENDSNIEIVLSVGLIQYCRTGNNNTISKTNQHIFHFPLKIEITNRNIIRVSFSDIDKPYCDFYFLNNLPIEKNR